MSLLLFILVTAYYYLVKSQETEICNQPHQCADVKYTCALGPCTILCSGLGACNRAEFHCPKRNTCNITCNSSAGAACEQTSFNVYDVSNLKFAGFNYQFTNGEITCGPNICNIQCGSLANSFSNEGMCKNSVINASTASILNITGTGTETLSYSKIYCPSKGQCIIHLNGRGAEAQYKFSYAQLHIDDPMHTHLNLTCENNVNNKPCYGNTENAPILYCYNSTYNCTYVTTNGIDWYCDTNSPCDNSTTISPTIEPTYAPTITPSIAPNNVKSGVSIGAILVVILLMICFCLFSGCYCYRRKKSQLNYLMRNYMINKVDSKTPIRSKSFPSISATPSKIFSMQSLNS